jgi:hypothetical protein
MVSDRCGEADEDEEDGSDRDFQVSQGDAHLLSTTSTDTDSSDEDEPGGSTSESTETDRDEEGVRTTFLKQRGEKHILFGCGLLGCHMYLQSVLARLAFVNAVWVWLQKRLLELAP